MIQPRLARPTNIQRRSNNGAHDRLEISSSVLELPIHTQVHFPNTSIIGFLTRRHDIHQHVFVRQDARKNLEERQGQWGANELDDSSRSIIGSKVRSSTYMRFTGLSTACLLFSPDDRSGEGYQSITCSIASCVPRMDKTRYILCILNA